MIVQVAHNLNGGATKIKTFQRINEAEDWIERMSEEDDDIRCQILVDYSEVQHYKEKFEELYEIMKIKTFGETEYKDGKKKYV